MTRWATVADAADLADVHVTSWQQAYQGIIPSTFLDGLDRASRRRWWEQFIDGGTKVHVIGKGRVIGFCHAGRSDQPGWGEIYSIYILPDHWGRGWGRELLTAAEETLKAEGFEHALLWVLEKNERARGFYESQGWKLGKPIRIEEIGGVQVTEVKYQIDL